MRGVAIGERAGSKLQITLYDKPNPWLNLVYMNLTIAFGHTEFTRAYHILRNETVKIVGRAITTEIERLAAQKMSCLLKNQNDFENAVNKAAFFASMQYITDEDSKYGQDYWITLYQKRNPSKQDSCN